MSHRRNGLWKQVTKAKAGVLELRRKREARKTYLGGGDEGKAGVCSLDRDTLGALS